MEGSTALFRTRRPTEDEIRDHYDDRIILTDSNTWDPVGSATPRKVSATSNTSAVHKIKQKVPVEGLRVCASVLQWNETQATLKMAEISDYYLESQLR